MGVLVVIVIGLSKVALAGRVVIGGLVGSLATAVAWAGVPRWPRWPERLVAADRGWEERDGLA